MNNMKNVLMVLLAGSALLSAPALANRTGYNNGADVVVPLPPQRITGRRWSLVMMISLGIGQ